MSKTEAIEAFAKEIYSNNQTMSSDDFDLLIEKADSQKERDFYAFIYNYILSQRAKEVIKNGAY